MHKTLLEGKKMYNLNNIIIVVMCEPLLSSRYLKKITHERRGIAGLCGRAERILFSVSHDNFYENASITTRCLHM